MSNWRLTRRHFITAAGTVFTLPLLEGLLPRSSRAAATSGDPRRFVSLYMPSGTYNRVGDAPWYPPVGPMTSNLPLVLAPFVANIRDFSVLTGIQCSARDAADQKMQSTLGRGGGHISSVTTWLTQTVYTDPGASQPSVPGDSFDQIVGKATQKAPFVLCGGCPGNHPDDTPVDYSIYVSYLNGKPVEPQMNPVSLYNSTFANLVPVAGPAPTPPPVPSAVRNKSILDLARADINDLKSKLGRSDNQKLDDYFTSLRSLELKLNGSGPVSPSGNSQCSAGTPPGPDLDNVDLFGDEQNYVARVKSFMDMVALAFKCDLTRSVSFMFDGENCHRHLNDQVPANLVEAGVSLTGEMHTGISHYGDNANGREKCISRDRLYMMLTTYLFDQLKQGTDVSGSPILDNTVVYAGMCVADGMHNAGGSAGVPIIVGGGRNFIHPGNVYDMSNFDLKDVLYTFSTHLQLGLPSFAGSSNVVPL